MLARIHGVASRGVDFPRMVVFPFLQNVVRSYPFRRRCMSESSISASRRRSRCSILRADLFRADAGETRRQPIRFPSERASMRMRLRAEAIEQRAWFRSSFPKVRCHGCRRRRRSRSRCCSFLSRGYLIADVHLADCRSSSLLRSIALSPITAQVLRAFRCGECRTVDRLTLSAGDTAAESSVRLFRRQQYATEPGVRQRNRTAGRAARSR